MVDQGDDKIVGRGSKDMSRRKGAIRSLRTETSGMESYVRRPSKHVLQRLREWEKMHRGAVAAVETESEEIFLGKNVVEATLKGWKKYPGRPFYFVRIGYPAVHRRRGGLRKP
jgi:hypothetical protein